MSTYIKKQFQLLHRAADTGQWADEPSKLTSDTVYYAERFVRHFREQFGSTNSITHLVTNGDDEIIVELQQPDKSVIMVTLNDEGEIFIQKLCDDLSDIFQFPSQEIGRALMQIKSMMV